MNLQQLRSMVAIAEFGSFSEAARRLGLTHSAISQQVRALEEEIGTTVVDRSFKPPTLTDRGRALVDRARQIETLTEEIRALGRDPGIVGSLTVGAVPSAMLGLLPRALGEMRRENPSLRCEIHVALSGDLAGALRTGEIDVAVATAPEHAIEGIRIREIAAEPLVVIAPADSVETDDVALLQAYPFIWFSRRTWAGQQIERRLLERGVFVQGLTEVDSLEAIAALVEQGLGVSIAPMLLCGPPLRSRLKAVPFGAPQSVRRLALFERENSPETIMSGELYERMRAQARAGGAQMRNGALTGPAEIR